jgi:ribosome-associated protein
VSDLGDLTIGRYTIGAGDLDETFTTSGGPGGQHANRNATAVELRYSVSGSDAFPPSVAARVSARLGDPVVVSVSESRSQFRNRAIARQRLAELLAEAAKPPPPPRRRTKPSRAAVERRLESKARRAETKRHRRRPQADH